MKIEAGEILKGKVTRLTKFGAFVELAPGKSGLVYISEIAHTYVKEVSDFLTVDQEVTVKVLNIDDSGRINLSVKQAAAPPPPPPPRRKEFTPSVRKEFAPAAPKEEASADSDFEDKLKRFMKDSEGRMSDIKRQSERYGGSKRRR